MNIPFLDLRIQYRQIEAELKPILEEIMASGAFIGGAPVAAFEEEFTVIDQADVVGEAFDVGEAVGGDEYGVFAVGHGFE